FRMEAAELKVKLGRQAAALADLEGLLGQLNPDSWLFREVRRKIDEVFLRNDDQAGLAKYYEAWVAKNPEDVEAMTRLARTLAAQGRVPESQQWLTKALKVAPSNKELRLALIEQYAYEQKFTEAAAQYEALVKNDPNNPDYLREWGKTILKDTSVAEEERKKKATEVWRRLIAARPKDPVSHTQVADLLRGAGINDEATVLYKKAIELAPDAAQYREYLGEFYHSLHKSDEALAAWREIAAGKNRTSKNLARLAEVFSGFGYLKEAGEASSEACKVEADDLNLQSRHAELLAQNEQYEEALKQLDVAARLASTPEDAESVLQQQIRNLQATEQLSEQIEKLEKELNAGTDAT